MRMLTTLNLRALGVLTLLLFFVAYLYVQRWGAKSACAAQLKARWTNRRPTVQTVQCPVCLGEKAKVWKSGQVFIWLLAVNEWWVGLVLQSSRINQTASTWNNVQLLWRCRRAEHYNSICVHYNCTVCTLYTSSNSTSLHTTACSDWAECEWSCHRVRMLGCAILFCTQQDV